MGIELLFLTIVYVTGSTIGFFFGKEIKKYQLENVYLEAYKKGSNDVIEFVTEALKK